MPHNDITCCQEAQVFQVRTVIYECIASPCQVAEDMYLEPTTGRIYSVARCPYLKIDLIWNHRNLWVNMQAPAGMQFFPNDEVI